MKKFIALALVVCLVASGLAVFFAAAEHDANSIQYSYKGRIAPYLHEVEFDSYTDDPTMGYCKDKISETSGACSSVRNGDFVGRNFDYFFNDVPTFVLKVNAAEGRFASIGVAQHWGLSEKDVISGNAKYDLNYLPNLTLDGVNEKGVYVNDNVVIIDQQNKVTGTNEDAEKTIHFLYVPRYILDHAESADHALQLLQNVNIVGSLKDKFYLHFMIADKDKTYIVEAYNNELIWKEYGVTGTDCVMTNFNLVPDHLSDDAKSLGYERYWTLQNNYDMSSTFDGMYYLMQTVRFSNSVLMMPPKSLPSDTTKLVSPWFSDLEIFTNGELRHIYTHDAEYEETVQKAMEFMPDFQKNYRKVINSDDRSIAKYWITIHNSTYDIKDFKLQVVVDEDYLHPYTFYLNEQSSPA